MNLSKRKDETDVDFVKSVVEWESENPMYMEEFDSLHSKLAINLLGIVHDFVLYEGEGEKLIKDAKINLDIDPLFLSSACSITASYRLKSDVINHLGITNELAEKYKEEIEEFYS